MTKTLTRVYNSYPSAELTVRELKDAGLGDSHIGIVASDAEGWHRPGGSDIDPKHDKDRDGKDDRAEGAVLLLESARLPFLGSVLLSLQVG
jgi:hypothetical protein